VDESETRFQRGLFPVREFSKLQRKTLSRSRRLRSEVCWNPETDSEKHSLFIFNQISLAYLGAGVAQSYYD